MRASTSPPQAPRSGRGWIVAVVVLWWSLRALMWASMGAATASDGGGAAAAAMAWTPEPGAHWQPLAGAALDAIVVASLAWLGRVARWRPVALAVVAVAGAARVLDFAHVAILRGHVDAISLWHLQPRAWRVGVEAGAPLVLGGMAAVAWFSARALGRAWRSRPAASSAAQTMPVRGRAWARGLFVASWPLCLWVAWWAPLHARHGATLPALGIAAEAVTLWLGPSPRSPTMDGDAAKRLARAGLLPDHVRLDAAVPLRAVATERPANGTRADGDDTSKRPLAIVWVMLESMNRSWTSLAARGGSAHPSGVTLATPGLDAVAALGTEFVGVHTAASPTHAASVAALCGVPPASWPIDADVGVSAPVRDCLPQRLASLGYATVMIQGSNLGFTGMDRLASAMGFGDVLGADDPLGPTGAPRSAWGWHDREVYAAALRRVRAAADTRRPLFLVVATSDSHWPGFADPRCTARLPEPIAAALDADAQQMARAVICADAELATFVGELEGMRLGSERLLLVTADHAAPEAASVRALSPPDGGGTFADLPLVVVGASFRPGAIVHVATSHLDLAASTLDWIGAPDVGGWLGRPVRLRPPPGGGQLQVGLAGRRAVGLRLGSERWQGAPGELRAACASGRVHPLAAHVGLQACDLARWIDWIDGLWRDGRLAPAAAGGPLPADTRRDESRSDARGR